MSSNRRLLVLVLSGVALIGFLLFFVVSTYTKPYRSLNLWQRQVSSRLETIKTEPPKGVEENQWVFIVGWTQTAIPNCFYAPDYILDQKRFEEFKQELEYRLSSNVQISTFEWIWGEIPKLTRNGDEYSKAYRPLPPFGAAHDGED